ncbi:MAG: DUF1501 domain-containing protein, partial [Planctomycetota bacterium]
MSRQLKRIRRRTALAGLGLGFGGAAGAGWFPALAQSLASDPRRRRRCILLWMSGGPSQTDTFDMKPGHANGGEFKERETSVPGMRFSEHLPQLAAQAEHLAIVRSLSTKEGDHARGAHLVRTGQPPMGAVAYPSIACTLAKELEDSASPLPAYVSVAPPQQINPAAFAPGFLGPRFAPAIVGSDLAADAANELVDLKPEHLELPPKIDASQAARRRQVWELLQRKFLQQGTAESFRAHHALYQKAADMMRPEVRTAFDLSQEPEAVRRKYGPGLFGQGCLLARRLVERGVPFVEVALGDGLGWDTHADNFRLVRQLSEQLDAGWGALMQELEQRDLLQSTTIVWMGEFGRTPTINANAGRDHFPTAWTCVFAGGGVAGG